MMIDQLMPGLSRDALARRIRSIAGIAETKLVIATSAGALGPAAESGVFDAVLAKPIREDSLLDAFARLFGTTTPKRGALAISAAAKPSKTAAESLRILVAEDNKINQQLATMLLGAAGHNIEIVENGEQAVEAVARREYDVVLMDVQMPVLDGVQATKRIRALSAPRNLVPIIALTAHAMAGAREEYLAAGMDDYLSKPLDAGLLFAKLADLRALRGSRPDESTVGDVTTGDAPVLDHARLAALGAAVPPHKLREFLGLFPSEARQLIERAGKVAGEGDLAAVAREAHALSGIAGNTGAMRTMELGRQLEAAVLCGRRERLASLLAAASAAADAAEAAIQAWLEPAAGLVNKPIAESA